MALVIAVPRWIGWPLVGVSACGIFAFLANRAVYYPLKHPAGWWEAQAEVGAVDVWLRAADGVKLHAWWIAPPRARLVTLFLHGNAGNLTFRVRHVRELVAAGSAMLLVDYRGYGKSEGRPTERGLYQDADAGYEYLLAQGYRPQQILVHGESLGTAVAVELAARRTVGGVLLEAPFPSARAVAARLLPWIGPAVVWGFDSRSRIGRLRAPLLVMHGDQDEIIPFDLGRALFDAAPEPKEFWRVPGAHHNDLLETAGASYREKLERFYASIR